MRRFDPKIIPPAHSNLPYEVVMVQSFDGDMVLHSDHAEELARVEKENTLLRAECEAWRACKGFTDERMFWAAAWTYEDGKAVIAARAATDAAGILRDGAKGAE